MRQALQSYTPTVKDLTYDSLTSRIGCEPEHGLYWFRATLGLPFIGFPTIEPLTLCVFDHNPHSFIFSQPDTICYQLAPTHGLLPLDPIEWALSAMWVTPEGVRFGEGIGYVVPPAYDVGTLDYPGQAYNKITFSFEANRRRHVAYETNPGLFFSIKWNFNDSGGVTEKPAIEGYSPMLFNWAILDPQVACTVCYYLRKDKPNTLFGRFHRDAYDIERQVIPSLNVNLSRIIRIVSIGNLVRMYAIDDQGRDVTITWPPVGPTLLEKMTLNTGFVVGLMLITEVPTVTQPQEKCIVTTSFVSGRMIDGTAEAPPGTGGAPAGTDKSTVTVDFDQGIISIP